MAWPNLLDVVESSKVIIAIAVMIYAYFFMRRSEENIERRPWEYLYIGAAFLFIAELVVALRIARPVEFSLPFFTSLERFAEFTFLGFFLFSFISQHHLLLKKRLLLIQSSGKTTWVDKLEKSWAVKRREHEERREEETFRKALARSGLRAASEAGAEARAGEQEAEEAPAEEEQPEEAEEAPPAPRPEDTHHAEEQPDVAEILDRGRKLHQQAKELLEKYRQRIDPQKATALRIKLAALKALLEEHPPRPDVILRQMALISGKQ
jgi:hypothetical protein